MITPIRTRGRLALLVAALLVVAGARPQGQTGTVVPVPMQTFFNASGTACSLCKLYTYAAGSSTPLSVYTTSALNVAHANPVVMDTLGRPSIAGTPYPIYLSPRGYKFTLTTSSGTVLWSVDNVLSVPTSDVASARQVAEGRLTLTSGTSVTTGDVSAATAVYYTPHRGNRIALYDGASTWNVRTFTEVTISLTSCTANFPYDVFLYDNGGTVTGTLVVWGSTTARASPLTRQDGIYVMSSVPTYRYVGTVYCNATGGHTDDTAAKRYVWNYDNRVPRVLRRTDSTDSWTYTTQTLRQAGGSTANQVEVMVGLAETVLRLTVLANATNSSGGATVSVGIGEDSTTTAATGSIMTTSAGAASTYMLPQAQLVSTPAIGRHVYAWLEYSAAGGTTTWLGDSGVATLLQTGIFGSIE